jgi:hypothetical protein
MFAGEAAVTCGLRSLGWRVLSLVIRYMRGLERARAMDLCTPSGFAVALWAMMTLRRNGVAFFAPVCSSWVWINRATSKRSAAMPLGREDLLHVSQGNLPAARTALLATLAAWKRCTWIIEQPSSSLFMEHPRMQQLLAQQCVWKHTVCMSWFGGGSLKRTSLWSNNIMLTELERKTDVIPKNPDVARNRIKPIRL